MDNIDVKAKVIALAISTAVLINCVTYGRIQSLTGEGLSPLPLTDELNFEDESEMDLNDKGISRARKPRDGYRKTNGYLKTTHNG